MRPLHRFLCLLAAAAPLPAGLAFAAAEPVLESSAGGYTGTLGRDGCLRALLRRRLRRRLRILR